MALPVPSGVALAIIVGTIVFSTASAFLSTAQQKQSYERLHPSLPVKKGYGPTSTNVTIVDRTGERKEIISGDNDRNIMKIIASEPVRPGTITRIDIHHPSSNPHRSSTTVGKVPGAVVPSTNSTLVELEGVLGEESW